MKTINRNGTNKLIIPLPLSELLEDDAVGEALSADTDSLQDTVTSELVQNQVRVQFTSLWEGNTCWSVCLTLNAPMWEVA